MRGKRLATREAKKLLLKCGIDVEKLNVKRVANLETNVEDIAAKLGIHLEYARLQDHISGAFAKNGDKNVIGVNEGHPRNRQRFTIAHEIGHYLMHASGTLHYDLGVKGSKDTELETMWRRSDSVSHLDEVEANHFAAELLMPEVLVNKCIESGIEEILTLANKFNVSKDAMRYRLINLGWL